MSDFNTVNNNDFMIEKIKERPVNRRKLLRRTLITAAMAVMFGLIACFTILLLEPVISNWLYPEEEEATNQVFLPVEEEEMQPEDMLETSEPEEIVVVQEPVNAQLDQEQVEEILSSVTLDKSHYIQLYNVMWEYAEELKEQIVIVTGVEDEYDWLANSYQKTNDTTGIIIAKDEENLYILTSAKTIKGADRIHVKMNNGKEADAVLRGKHSELDLAVLCVSLPDLGYEIGSREVPVAVMGSSWTSNPVGSPVVVLGSPMGTTDSVGYGMLTDKTTEYTFTDCNMDIITTDIYGSQNAQGYLFNMRGELIGIVTSTKVNSDMKNMITAYGISDIKYLINTLIRGDQAPYLGIKGISVTREANQESQIPYGAYVTEVVRESPAMLVGMQKGDVIVAINDVTIDSFSEYERVLYNLKSGETVTVQIMRYSQGTYKEMTMDVVLGGVE